MMQAAGDAALIVECFVDLQTLLVDLPRFSHLTLSVGYCCQVVQAAGNAPLVTERLFDLKTLLIESPRFGQFATFLINYCDIVCKARDARFRLCIACCFACLLTTQNHFIPISMNVE